MSEKREIQSRYLPMFCSYRPLTDVFRDGDSDGNIYAGLSAPFPISSEKMLDETIRNASLADLKILFCGFFDPLGRFDSEKNIYHGGFANVSRLVPVDNAVSFGGYLRGIAANRHYSLLYAFESKKGGENDEFYESSKNV